MKIILIAAMSQNRAIGRANALPWHLPGDLKRFRAVTQGCPVVMGRKTYESIGRLLPKRLNIIITRNPSELQSKLGVVTLAAGTEVWVRNSIEGALEDLKSKGAERVYILGGGQIYLQALSHADEIDLTDVKLELPDGDAFFPEFEQDFIEVAREPGGRVAEGEAADYDFVRYERSKR